MARPSFAIGETPIFDTLRMEAMQLAVRAQVDYMVARFHRLQLRGVVLGFDGSRVLEPPIVASVAHDVEPSGLTYGDAAAWFDRDWIS